MLAYQIYFSFNPELGLVILEKDKAERLYNEINDPRFILEEFDTDTVLRTKDWIEKNKKKRLG